MEYKIFEPVYLLKLNKLLTEFRDCYYNNKEEEIGPKIESLKGQLIKKQSTGFLAIEERDIVGVIIFNEIYECAEILLMHMSEKANTNDNLIAMLTKFFEIFKNNIKKIKINEFAWCLPNDKMNEILTQLDFELLERYNMSLSLDDKIELFDIPDNFSVNVVKKEYAQKLGEIEFLSFKDTIDRKIMYPVTIEGHQKMIEEILNGRFGKINFDISFVLRDKNKIIGAILCMQQGFIGFIYDIFILPEYKGKKLGKWLLLKTLKKMKEKDFKFAQLTVTAQNIPATKLYESTGFKVTETIKVYVKELQGSIKRK